MFPWRTAGRLLLVLTALTAFAGSASAQLPPDQRRQMRQEMRDYWRQAPPDDRQRFREERRAMPPDDRQRMRDEMRGQQRGYGGGNPYGGNPYGGNPYGGGGQRGGRH
ncbi:MAG: hypothetical protein HT580_06475 [Dechloromonas sp.]|nr:MAG: hypothetical protein HT580_06475 [Dechloromonas sp.]